MFGEREANLPEAFAAKPARAKRGVVTLTFASWNQINHWLKELEQFRVAA